MRIARPAVVVSALVVLVVATALPAQAARRVTEYPVGVYSGSITAGPDGNLWFPVVFANAVAKITTRGSVTEYPIPAQHTPGSITAGPDGNVWFTESNVSFIGDRIAKITPIGGLTEYRVPTYISGPAGITAGPDSNLWFTEATGNNIGRITTAGVITEFPLDECPPIPLVPADTCWPSGITAGPDGNLWFTEHYGNNIGKITTAGVVTEFPIPTPFS